MLLLILVFLFALAFEVINAFHDAGNTCATTISTRVLSLRNAVIFAALFNFIGALSGTSVAKTIATGFVNPALVTQSVIIFALIGAIVWNLITWYKGIPSSSSHALIGGLTGAVLMNSGVHVFNWVNLKNKVIIPIFTSPLIGFLLAFVLMILLSWLFKFFSHRFVSKASRYMQLVSAASMGMAHGTGDSQKTLGIIFLALLSYNATHKLPTWILPANNAVPYWLIILCSLTMGLGTLIGGKRIIKTLGSKIIKITPLQGFAAETSGALTILMASKFGMPISTTHAISSAIMGVGTVKRASAVRWGIANNMFLAWVLTIPVSAGIAGGLLFIFKHILRIL